MEARAKSEKEAKAPQQFTGILEMLEYRGSYEVSISDPGRCAIGILSLIAHLPEVTLSKNKRFLGNIRKRNLASHNLSAIRILGSKMRSGRYTLYPPERGFIDCKLQHWKSHLCGNNSNFGASFGRSQLYAPSCRKNVLATVSIAGPCAGKRLDSPTVSVGTTWIFDSVNHLDIHIGYYKQVLYLLSLQFQGECENSVLTVFKLLLKTLNRSFESFGRK